MAKPNEQPQKNAPIVNAEGKNVDPKIAAQILDNPKYNAIIKRETSAKPEQFKADLIAQMQKKLQAQGMAPEELKELQNAIKVAQNMNATKIAQAPATDDCVNHAVKEVDKRMPESSKEDSKAGLTRWALGMVDPTGIVDGANYALGLGTVVRGAIDGKKAHDDCVRR